MKKLDVKALALALGITWALGVLLAGWVAPTGWCDGFVRVMASVYLGYEPGFTGGLIGGIWAFFDGAIGGMVIALVYNLFAKSGKDSR